MSETQTFRHTADMRQISGFGGGYESTCQDMLEAGVRWLHEHPQADPRFMGNSQIYGVILEDNEDAKALTAAVMTPQSVKDLGATGAMHHAVISRLIWIRANGWDRYCEECRHDARSATDAD